MPNYEYVCKSCGDGFEVAQAFTDPALTTCDACGGPLKKVYGSVGIVFKGSGFYRTDNRTKSSTSTPASNGSGAAKADAKASETNPPGKKEPAAKDASGPTSTDAAKKPATKTMKP
jgi:putative FmdB family regulatory protein